MLEFNIKCDKCNNKLKSNDFNYLIYEIIKNNWVIIRYNEDYILTCGYCRMNEEEKMEFRNNAIKNYIEQINKGDDSF